MPNLHLDKTNKIQIRPQNAEAKVQIHHVPAEQTGKKLSTSSTMHAQKVGGGSIAEALITFFQKNYFLSWPNTVYGTMWPGFLVLVSYFTDYFNKTAFFLLAYKFVFNLYNNY